MFSTQREQDDETDLLYYRARSYSTRLGRFIQKDPIPKQSLHDPYSYASNRPTISTDPAGTKSIIISKGDTIAIVTFVLLYFDEFSITDDENKALAEANKLSKAIHEKWNNCGRGWNIRVTENGHSVSKSLFVLPNIVATTKSHSDDNEYYRYDKIRLLSTGGSSIESRQSLNLNRTIPYTGTPIPPDRGIPLPYDMIHTGRININAPNPSREYAHEYGHLIGLADRYQGHLKSIDDAEWSNMLMAATGATAGDRDIEELAYATFGIDALLVTPRSDSSGVYPILTELQHPSYQSSNTDDKIDSVIAKWRNRGFSVR